MHTKIDTNGRPLVITDAWLRANLNKRRLKVDEVRDRDALSVRVSKTGKIVFQIRFRYPVKGGPGHRCDLGSYPTMALAEARSESARLRNLLAKGHDPRIVLLLEREKIRKLEVEILEVLFTAWYENWLVDNKLTHKQIKRSFEIHVFPKLGKLPVDEIVLPKWLEVLEDLAKRMPGIADIVLVNAKQMLKWGVKRQRIANNRLVNITAAADLQIKKNTHTRALDDEETRHVWHGIEQCQIAPRNKLYLKLCLVYGCRHTELRKAKRVHFDLERKVWIIPPENHKTGQRTKKPLLRPITPETEPLIRQALFWAGEGEYMFPSKVTKGQRSQSSQTSFPIRITVWLKKKRNYVIAPWSVKSLRKTARTNFSTLAPPLVAEIMLGHKLPGSWDAYDQHTYLVEQAAAYSAWCQRIMRIVESDSLLGFEQPKQIQAIKSVTPVLEYLPLAS